MMCSQFIQLVLAWGRTVMCLVIVCVTTIRPLIEAYILSNALCRHALSRKGAHSLAVVASSEVPNSAAGSHGDVVRLDGPFMWLSCATKLGKTQHVYIMIV